MDRVHRGTGRARSTSLEDVREGHDAVHAGYRDGALPGLDTKQIYLTRSHFKYPESSVPTGTLTVLTRCKSSYGVGRGPSDLQATQAQDWTCIPRELVLGCPVFLYLSQASLVTTRSATEEIFMHHNMPGYMICHVKQSSVVTSLYPG